ncbi:MATE family efflux transporter [Lacrimispora sp.]|uniref:MATE family efflux transporter n=1 Tax=Lacrimispora sp. TaxID=2719234 RepID=UPI0028A58756|nr:MATE family efflux transporter [Lacrimispora sp.]
MSDGALKYDLTSGKIMPGLLRLSLPTMGVQLIQLAYSFASMFWLGRLSSSAVAASGTVGILLWLSLTLQNYGRKGSEIGVSQCLGARNFSGALGYLQTSLSIALILGLICGGGFLGFAGPLIGFFGIIDPRVENDAVIYLRVIACAIPFTYVNDSITAAFNASGNSAKPFYINLICLFINSVLDPLLIFAAGMGVTGAAVSTVLCQMLSCMILLRVLKNFRHEAFAGMKIWRLPRIDFVKPIIRWGTPGAAETFCFTFFVMIVSRIVASFGSDAMAVQRIGNQVDQFSYLVSAGFAAALTAFIGQNFGAGQYGRIWKGFAFGTLLMSVWGVAATLNLVFFNRFFFLLFVPGEPEVVSMGARYLRIFALCQFAACLEGVGQSVFRGYGRTLFPSLISIFTNGLRVLLAYLLSGGSLAQEGIWWAISISAFLRGGLMYAFSLPYVYKIKKRHR